MQSTLVLVRHGESEWNAKNVWTGLTDIGLTPKGRNEATLAGEALTDISFDVAFSSPLSRSRETLRIILFTLEKDIPAYETPAITERDYGIYTGKNKQKIHKDLGDESFFNLRRGWDYEVPEGETLKQVYERVVPFYKQEMLPLLKKGKNVLVVAHGNSLRALIKYLDGISDEDIANVEIKTGEMVVYQIDASGNVVSSKRRTI